MQLNGYLLNFKHCIKMELANNQIMCLTKIQILLQVSSFGEFMDNLCYKISKGNGKGVDRGDDKKNDNKEDDKVDDKEDDKVDNKGDDKCDGTGGDNSMFAALDIGCAYHYYMFSIKNRQRKVRT